MLVPIQGYFCSICDSFFDTRDKAFQEHCSTKTHYENYIVSWRDFANFMFCLNTAFLQNLYNETLKLQRSVDQNSSSLELSNNNDLGNNNPLPIKIKIENTDTFSNNDKVKKPLSERLGAVKKTNRQKSKKKLKQNSFQLFDGDYNKSVLQYLPKPSSHITPSRKVFVEDYNIMQSKFGPNTPYSTPMYQNI